MKLAFTAFKQGLEKQDRMFKSFFADLRTFDLKSVLPFLLVLMAASYPLFFSAHFATKIVCIIVAMGGAIAFCRQGAGDEASPSSLPNFYLALLTAVSLGLLTWLAYYRPMLEHFWVGYDEPFLLAIKTPWFATYDACCARPLAGLEAYFGNLILPQSIWSLPLANAVDRWILSMGVFLLMFSLQPRAPLFALAAGLLMVVNPTELLRFTPGLGLPYGGAMMFLIAAASVFVLSYNLASRLLLLLACALLETAFLHYETILLVSIMAPVLLWLLPAKPQRLLWAAAWYLTAFLAFVRFAVFFFGGSTYQSNYVRQFSFSSLFKYFPLLFKPIFRFLTPLFDQNLFTLLPMALGIATFILLIFVVVLFSRQAKEPLIPARRQTAIIGLASLVAVTLTLLPEISVPALLKAMPNFDGDLTSRLEFTPGPFQAIAWVAAIGWISSFLSRPQYWFAAGISILVSCSVLDAVELQAKHGTLNAYLDLQKESDILRSAAPMIQQSPPDSIIFFAIPDDSPSPFGFGYHPYYMTCLLFGRESYAGHYSPKYGIRRRATAFPSPIDAADNYVPLKGIKNLIVLSVDDHQNVTPIKIQPAEPAELKASGTSGPCLIPQAKALPNGDLPFLLPSLKEP